MPLQWGHGISAVELCARNTAASNPACFNGATAFLPWNSVRALHTLRCRCGLQWGHGISAVEFWSASGSNGWMSRCFNGATAFLPWN